MEHCHPSLFAFAFGRALTLAWAYHLSYLSFSSLSSWRLLFFYHSLTAIVSVIVFLFSHGVLVLGYMFYLHNSFGGLAWLLDWSLGLLFERIVHIVYIPSSFLRSKVRFGI